MAWSLSYVKSLLVEEEYAAGLALYQRGGVKEISATAEQAEYHVAAMPAHKVCLYAGKQPECTCLRFHEDGCCRHMAAALAAASRSGVLERLEHTRAVAAAPKLLAAMESALPEDGSIRLEISLTIEEEEKRQVTRIGLRVGEDRLYVVRSIPQFIEAMDAGEPLDFGKGFSFRPEWMRFTAQEMQVLGILRRLCAAQRDCGVNLRGADLRLMKLPEPFAEDVLQALREVPFKLVLKDRSVAVKRIHEAQVPLHFKVTCSMHGLMITGLYPKDFQPLTTDCSFAAAGGTVVAVAPDQRTIMRVLWQEQGGGHASFAYTMREAPRVIGELVPFLKLCGVVEITPEVEKLLEKLPLVARVYLDRDGKLVVARTQFCYGSKVIDPFDETPLPEMLSRGEKLLLRDAAAERVVLDTLGSAGFRVSKGRVYLSGQDDIYRFVSGGLGRLQEKCEVYASRDFQRMAPRKPALTGSLSRKNGRLELTFKEAGEISEEILGIMEALAKHRQYYRLKDGSFLDLSDMDEWQAVADMVTEAAQIEGADRVLQDDAIVLASYRLCYLSTLLEQSRLPVTQDESVKQIVRSLNDPDAEEVALPEGLNLRAYQQRGFRWLHTLDQLEMGGILADDMGLGKTVQVISLFKAIHQAAKRDGKPALSLVVSPTSLTYNWLSELKRFAPELSVAVMTGGVPQRAAQISQIKQYGDVDIIITSYPLIRRDIDMMADIDFRFVVLDEAQQIKNAGSVGAGAVKKLKARTRFALTGTPMENSIGELWSIFDFVLPGYLGGYSSFLRRYQEDGELDDLRRRIRPFLMRRLKRDVLKELPEKNETVLTATMTSEQQKVYDAAMLRLRDHVNRVMTERGLGRSRNEVLAALMELRQICCHPSLVLGGYFGSAGKLDMLMDVLPNAISEGRRVLLFSQFTSMLKILLKQLEANGFSCMYLDGDTPGSERLELTERFNHGNAQVFLISLKAGGTGLNLTGADMVILYDPWWNPAAEEQAIDRCYRIGQTRNVDVIRLVTHESIEEQVVALGQRKKALFDQLITPGEELVTTLTEDDIRALFA